MQSFLVFKYIGNSAFFVKVFGHDGFLVAELPTVQVEDEPEEEEAAKNPSSRPSSSKPI